MAALEAEEIEDSHRRPKYWVSPYLKDRNAKGRFATDFENMRNSPKTFVENFRMTPETFDKLYDLLLPHLLRKRNTRPYDCIPEKAKLAIVLE